MSTASPPTKPNDVTAKPCQASLVERLLHLERVNREPYLRSLEVAVCRNDPAHWVNHWCFTYDPREQPSLRPFDLFPKQAEFLTWLQQREAAEEDGLVEKSRDMGVTWLCAAYALHGWLFRQGFSVGFGSRKRELVDAIGNPDSILEKVRILIRNLPGWMVPAAFKPAAHDNLCKILNPATGSAITGEGGDDIGRGGRQSLYFVDEAAHLQHPDLVEASLSQTSRCRVWVSTPEGQGNPFAKKRHGGNIAVFTFHWKDDPRKNGWVEKNAASEIVRGGNGQAPNPAEGGTVLYPWYEREKRRLDNPVVIAQELDIDYTASLEGVCIPAAWVRAAVGLPLKASGLAIGGLDVADEGANRNVFISRRGPVVSRPVDWGQLNTTQTAHRAADEAEREQVFTLNYDSIGVGAGLRGTYNSSERRFKFRTNAVNVGQAPTDTRWPDGKTSKERFLNLKAELWWILRTRFEKAYEHRLWLEGNPDGKRHPDEEMISLPNDERLISQLSLPRYFATETGKIKIESKEQLSRRGVASPDFAEALVLTFMVVPVMGQPSGGGTRESLENYNRGRLPVPGRR